MHDLPAECKLVAAVSFVLVVVVTPRDRFVAFGAYAVLLAALATAARVPAGIVLRRMVIELPFVAFALLLPFVAIGEQVQVAGVGLSVEGLYGAWNVLAKGTLGVVCSILLAATTDLRALLAGLSRLRMPSVLVQILTFMLRYADLIAAEMHRMRIARESRGFHARDLRHLPMVARSAGALFIRCYERGERVHLAMLSRGYTGQMPELGVPAATPGHWAAAAVLPGMAMVVALLSWSLA